jgi:hypothetical protein
MSLEASHLTKADIAGSDRHRAPIAATVATALALPHLAGAACGCLWIDGDDFLERLHRGERIHCGAPARRPGESYCAKHHARAYLPTWQDAHRQLEDLTLEQRQRYGDLRRGGLPFGKAIELARRVAPALTGQLAA